MILLSHLIEATLPSTTEINNAQDLAQEWLAFRTRLLTLLDGYEHDHPDDATFRMIDAARLAAETFEREISEVLPVADQGSSTMAWTWRP